VQFSLFYWLIDCISYCIVLLKWVNLLLGDKCGRCGDNGELQLRLTSLVPRPAWYVKVSIQIRVACRNIWNWDQNGINDLCSFLEQIKGSGQILSDYYQPINALSQILRRCGYILYKWTPGYIRPPPLSPNTIEKSFFGSLDAINRDFLSPRPGRTCFLGSTPKAQLTWL